MPFIKPGSRPGAAHVATPPPGVASPGTGTVSGADTSKVQKLRKHAVEKPLAKHVLDWAEHPPEVRVTKESSDNSRSMFEGLVDVASPLDKVNRSRTTNHAAPGRKHRRWPVWTGIPSAALALGLTGWVLACVLFKAHTPNGTIVVENVPIDAEVELEGSTVTLTRNGKTVTVTAVAQGPHRLKVVQDGHEIWSSDLTVKLGDDPIRFQVPSQKAPVQKDEGREGGPPPATAPPAAAPPPAAPPGQAGAALPRKVFGTAILRRGNQLVKGNSSWRTDRDELVQESEEGGWASYPSLVFGNPDWSRYDLTLKGKWEHGPQGFGIVFHYRDPGNHYFLYLGSYGNHASELCSLHQGRWDRQPGMYRAGPIRRGEWYDVRIEVREEQFRCLVNGELLFSSRDDRFKSGLVGFRPWGCAARFRDIQITAPDGTLLWNGLPDLPGDPAQNVEPDGAEAVKEAQAALDLMYKPRHRDPKKGGRPGLLSGRNLPGEAKDANSAKEAVALHGTFTSSLNAMRDDLKSLAPGGAMDEHAVAAFKKHADACIQAVRAIQQKLWPGSGDIVAGNDIIDRLRELKKNVDDAANRQKRNAEGRIRP